MQSPINIDPGNLLYDHTLGPILVGPDKVENATFVLTQGLARFRNFTLISGEWQGGQYWPWCQPRAEFGHQ